MKVGDTFKPDTVYPPEPPVGSTVRDRTGDKWHHFASGKWRRCRLGGEVERPWAHILQMWGAVTLTEVPAELGDPTIRWQDVRAGMTIRITHRWSTGVVMTVEGVVDTASSAGVTLATNFYPWRPGGGPTTEVRLLRGWGMSEPPVGTVVRHAGVVFARLQQGGDAQEARGWRRIRGKSDGQFWWSWRQILDLDPGVQPVILDLDE